MAERVPLGRTNSKGCRAQDVIKEAWGIQVEEHWAQSRPLSWGQITGALACQAGQMGHIQQVGRTQIQPSLGKRHKLGRSGSYRAG